MKSYLAVLLLVASLSACGREPSQPSPAGGQAAPPATAPAAPATVAAAASAAAATAASVSDVAVERVAALAPEGQLPVTKWVAGTHYKVLSPAQPTDAPPGKVEVIEFFWYACPHCYAFDPYLENWRKDKPVYIDFTRSPVMWDEVHRAQARLFYTLLALGKLDQLHPKVFDQIHQQQDPLYAPGDAKATLADQLRFAKANGISESDFVTAYNSFGVQASLQKADDLMRRDRVESVPTIVIAGKYVSDLAMAGGPANLIQLINDLAASEKHH